MPTAQHSATPADLADTASRLLLPLGVEITTSSALSSVSVAITRLRRERIEELHAHYKKELLSKEESHTRRDSSINSRYLKVTGDLEATKQHLDQVKSLCDTQNLMIKRLQEELDEEAELDPDKDPHVRRVRREYEQRIKDYEERIRQLESERREDHDEQTKEVERMRRERNIAREEATEAQREKV